MFGQKIFGTLLDLLHLGSAVNLFYPFVKTKGSQGAVLLPIPLSLSPKDPNFPEWWEEHKSEWEEPKKEGQEPADD